MTPGALIWSLAGSAAALAAGLVLAADGAMSSTAPIPLPEPQSIASGAIASGDRVIEGPAVPTKYGPMQVAIAVRRGRLVRIWPLQLTNRYGRSVRASTTAAPVLGREALAAGSAHIDGVSGATYTSDGYRRSLQGALDRIAR